jgi:prevent-host-death family protein
MSQWDLSDAQAKLSDVVRKAEISGPQIISRDGIEVAVVVSIADSKRLGLQLAEG